jgi:6-phosphofructokinase 1
MRASAPHTEGRFVTDDTFVRYHVEVRGEGPDEDLLFEKAGPREAVFFDPARTRAAIVTCGGLCPGLNNVIRSAFLELYHNYGVRDVMGIRYGFRGLNPDAGLDLLRLTPDRVENIAESGGTILGTSRGHQDAGVMVDTLEREGINLLLCLGGDGTQRGAHRIYEAVTRRGLPIAIVGIPKTIDNDVQFCQVTFGYNTAIDAARVALRSAHWEARSAFNGVGLLKCMGRESGFIAVGATLASGDVNFTLIPEIPFRLEGPGGFLEALEKRLQRRHHAVVVVAEGAGQDLFEAVRDERDASGNIRYHDIGLFLKQRITEHFTARSIPIDLKYIDPSYVIRAVPANCHDSLLCDQLARRAVHAGMSGRTDLIVGFWNRSFMHVPIPLATASTKRIDPDGEHWASVLSATGQPRSFT